MGRLPGEGGWTGWVLRMASGSPAPPCRSFPGNRAGPAWKAKGLLGRARQGRSLEDVTQGGTEPKGPAGKGKLAPSPGCSQADFSLAEAPSRHGLNSRSQAPGERETERQLCFQAGGEFSPGGAPPMALL